MLRAAAREAGRATRRLSHGGGAAAAWAAGRQQFGSLAKLVEGSSGYTSAAALTALTITISTSVAYASSPMERSFIMVKPDGVHRGLVGDIIKRFEAKGYKLVGTKVLVPGRDLASAHYAEHDGKPFFPKLVDFLTSGAVVAMVWEGKEIVKYGRTMIGATNPVASAPGTIRGDLAVDMGRNVIHGSDSVESAQREIALWFGPDELADYNVATSAWLYE